MEDGAWLKSIWKCEYEWINVWQRQVFVKLSCCTNSKKNVFHSWKLCSVFMRLVIEEQLGCSTVLLGVTVTECSLQQLKSVYPVFSRSCSEQSEESMVTKPHYDSWPGCNVWNTDPPACSGGKRAQNKLRVVHTTVHAVSLQPHRGSELFSCSSQSPKALAFSQSYTAGAQRRPAWGPS